MDVTTIAPQSASTLPSWLDWIHYLPPVFQQPETWFMFIVSFALYGYLKSFDLSDFPECVSKPFPQVGTMAGAVAMACALHVGGSYPYAIGTGGIAAWASSSFYDSGFFWLTKRIQAWTGTPPSSSELPDLRKLPPPPNPQKTNP